MPLVLMTAPLAPHVAEELWERLGHEGTLAYQPFPVADPAWLAVDTVEIAVQLNGKVRARVTVPSDLDEAATEAAARGRWACRRAARGRDGAQGHRRPGPAGQLRRGLRRIVRSRRLSPDAVAHFTHVDEVDRLRARSSWFRGSRPVSPP